jgi:uncharacterized membrane protein YphA (DoxX/SURF4 family)
MNWAMEILIQALQVIVALGLLNVWLLRAGKSTPYRGGEASSMREEFSTYGLPASMMYVVGGLKVIIALAMIAGLWIPALVIPAAAVLIVLMAGAFVMHLKVKDPFTKSIPAILMMDIAILIIVFSVFFTQP